MATRRKADRPRPLRQQWDLLHRELSAVLQDAGLTVGEIPGHDCYLYWDKSSTPIVLTNKFPEVIALAERIEPLLEKMESMWNVFVFEDSPGEDAIFKRYLISAVGSRPM